MFNLSFGQDEEKYSELTNEAWSLYETKDYKQSAEKYSEAFIALGNTGYVPDRYNAACSWALAKEIDSSFVQLLKIAEKGNYTNYNHISTDSDLDILHSDQRWREVLALVKTNKEKEEANFDKPLVAVLDTIYEEDQGLRKQLGEVEQKYGRNSEEMKSYWNTIAEKDSINLIKIQNILDERGWLGQDVIGRRGNTTLFLVIQHSDLPVQEKYLPMMRDAVAKGNARASSLALLEDRVALAQGKKQIYGSQVGRNPDSGVYYVSPLEDPDNVDKRRAEVGLQPLQDYISHWDMTWDVEKYKRELPELVKQRKQ
ncbi:MAG: DUF6624 domain-containing protein [Aequorivita sp.]